MKIVFTGAEFYLSNYLNCLKFPIGVFIVFLLVELFYRAMMSGEIYDEDESKAELHKAFIIRHPFISFVASALGSLYFFLVWI